MEESFEEIPELTHREVLAALTASHEEGVKEEDRASHEAFVKLRAYIQAEEQEIDRCEDAIEAEFRRIEFSFELGKLYLSAGYIQEAKDILLQSLAGALSGGFDDLYWNIHNFYLESGGTEEEINNA